MKTANVGRGFDLSFKRFKSGHTQSGDTRSKLRISLIFLLLTTLIASSGCSMALRFGYNHADWFVYRSLKPYINLNDEQRVDFDQRFDEIWQWHRTSELPRYAAELRRLAAETANPPEAYTAELVKQQTFRFGEIFIRASEHLLPDAVAILEDLNDKQVEKLLAQLQEDNERRKLHEI